VHLPDEQSIYFDTENDEELQQRLNKKSTLMAWFQLNREDENANNYY